MEKHTTSTSQMIFCLATILILGAPTAHGKRLKAKIEFEPKTVVPIVTLRLTLKCALVPADPKDEDGVFDVKSVLGVSIKQKNDAGDFEKVASVSTSNSDDPELDGHWNDNETAAEAHLHNYTRLLEVTVTEPTVDHTGDMLCEIYVNDGEAVETMSDQDTIGYQEPNMTIFLKELRRLKLRDEDQQLETLAQQMEIVLQKEKLQEAEKKITDLETKASTQVSFCAVMNNGSYYSQEQKVPNPLGGFQVKFNRTLVNVGGGYDTNTGVFTCPVPGTYFIRFDFHMKREESYTYQQVLLWYRNSKVRGWLTESYEYGSKNYDGVVHLGGSIVLKLDKGDELSLYSGTSSYFVWTHNGYPSLFSGFLIK